MWTEVNSRQHNNKVRPTMHQQKFVPTCAFCKQIGKEFRGHIMRDNHGQVVCPQLLSNECRYCHEKGHTPKYCPVLQSKKTRSPPSSETFENENMVTTEPEEKIWVSAVMTNSFNMNTLITPQETIDHFKKNECQEKPSTVLKKTKPRPKLWSEYESDEEYDD